MYPWLQPYYLKVIRAFQQGHRHHALLFKAEQGLGIEQLLTQIGAWIICQQPAQTPCDQCHSCHLRKAQNHPDIYQLAPLEGKDIGVEQVREINEKIAQYAQQGGNKLVYVQGVERLTEAAANALLKTLEEPRPNTYFLLQADVSAPIMPTIYSRCQVHLIHTPDPLIVRDWLQQQIQDDSATAQEIEMALTMNYSRPLSALTTLQQGLVEKRKEFLRQFWLFYKRLSPLELLPYFDKELKIQQIDWILGFLSDALKARLQIQQHRLFPDLVNGIQQFSEEQTEKKLLSAIQIMQQVRLDLIQINGVNPELILLDGLTRLITEIFEG